MVGIKPGGCTQLVHEPWRAASVCFAVMAGAHPVVDLNGDPEHQQAIASQQEAHDSARAEGCKEQSVSASY